QPLDTTQESHSLKHINRAADHLVVNLFRVALDAIHVDRRGQMRDLVRLIFSQESNKLREICDIAFFENDLTLDLPNEPGKRPTARIDITIDDLIPSFNQHPAQVAAYKS